jgi:cytoskeletal protein RodZ
LAARLLFASCAKLAPAAGPDSCYRNTPLENLSAAMLGKKLNQARMQKGLTIDEAAHVTKLRPDIIGALETDDYARFPSNAYAKGFLQIYGRFLAVDISEFARTLDSTNHISVADYQYLSNGVPRPVDRAASLPRDRRRRAPSLLPLFVFVTIAVLAVIGMQIFVVWQRLNPRGSTDAATPAATATGGLAPDAANPTEPASNPAQAPDRDASVPDATPTAGDQSFLNAPETPRTGPDEVVVEPIRTTWVTVRTGSAKSMPVFEDFLYPGGRLKFKGTPFFIEAREPSAIQIRRNGTPIAYQPSNVEVP